LILWIALWGILHPHFGRDNKMKNIIFFFAIVQGIYFLCDKKEVSRRSKKKVFVLDGSLKTKGGLKI
jgi:hypothetical protein